MADNDADFGPRFRFRVADALQTRTRVALRHDSARAVSVSCRCAHRLLSKADAATTRSHPSQRLEASSQCRCRMLLIQFSRHPNHRRTSRRRCVAHARRRTRLLRSRRELSRRPRFAARRNRSHPDHRLPPRSRRREYGRSGRQIDRPPGRRDRHARSGRNARIDRRAHRVSGLHADDPADRPMRTRTSRSRGVPGNRLSAHVRSDGEVGRADRRSEAHSRILEPCVSHRDVGSAGAGRVVVAGRCVERRMRSRGRRAELSARGGVASAAQIDEAASACWKARSGPW